MPTTPPFRRQIEATQTPGASAEAKPAAEMRRDAPAPIEERSPPTPGWAVAETARAEELPIPRTALPFTPGAPPAALVIEGLTLEDYAALCAALATRPAEADAMFAARGLADPAKRRAADAAWRAHLASDAAADARWQELYRKHAVRAR